MSNMREIKARIKSVQETKQITKAMKLISAAKLKKAKNLLEQTRPFFNRVKYVMADIMLRSGGNIDSIFFDISSNRKGKKIGYVVITGDKTLAGGYNHNIIKLAEKELDKNPDSTLYVVGQVGRNHFLNSKYNMNKDFDFFVNKPTVYRARDITDQIIQSYLKGVVDEVTVIYTTMVSSLTFETRIMQLLPLEYEKVRHDLMSTKCGQGELDEANNLICPLNQINHDENLLYEPSAKAVFNVLVSKYVKGILYGVLVEAYTSEHTARMIAMENATSNADKILGQLRQHYNLERQAMITQEISEIVGGAEALK